MPLPDAPPPHLRSLLATAFVAAACAAVGPSWGAGAFAGGTPAEQASQSKGATAQPGWNLQTLQALEVERIGEVLDLAQAWRLTVLNDPDYHAALSARAAAETERRQGRAAILPQVQAGHSRSSITGGQTQYDARGVGRALELDFDSTSTYIQLQQPLFNVGRYAEYRRGQARAALGQAEFHEREQATALRLTEVYLEALRTHSQWDLSRQLAESLETQAGAQERLYEANEGSRIDAQETRARLALARSHQIRSRDARDVALRELEAMIGRPAGALAQLTDDFHPYTLRLRTQDEWVSLARNANPAVQAALERLRIAETELQRATGRYLPSVDLVAAYAKADSENLSSLSQRSNTWTVGLHASVPLFSGGYDTANRARASAQLEQARKELAVAREAAEIEAARQYVAVAGGAERVRALMSAVLSAQEGLDAAQAAYRYGMRSNVDVLRSRDRVYEARSRLVDERLSYLAGLARLHAAAGRLAEPVLDDLAAEYFPRS